MILPVVSAPARGVTSAASPRIRPASSKSRLVACMVKPHSLYRRTRERSSPAARAGEGHRNARRARPTLLDLRSECLRETRRARMEVGGAPVAAPAWHPVLHVQSGVGRIRRELLAHHRACFLLRETEVDADLDAALVAVAIRQALVAHALEMPRLVAENGERAG